MVDISDGANYAPTAKAEVVVGPGEFQFAAVGLDHGHINGQCNGLLDAGATLKCVQVAERMGDVLQDPDLKMVASAVIPNDRAELGRKVLAAGKDYFTDKSPFTSLDQLSMVRDVVSVTRRKYMVYYAERLHNDAAWTAGEMIKDGAIGRVLQVLNIAPHRLARDTRPLWFFDKDCYGGILTDIGSHQVEQFITYAGCHDATINFARVANMNNPTTPDLEDFGELSLTGDNGASFYTRVDWFTPDGLRTWGDGTEGTMELRKYMDVAREAPSSRLFLVNGEGEQEIECLGRSGFPFFGQMILDSLNRTEHAMTQRHVFKAAEISMQAQLLAEQALESAGD